jgi:hypothetical protein
VRRRMERRGRRAGQTELIVKERMGDSVLGWRDPLAHIHSSIFQSHTGLSRKGVSRTS